MDKNKPPQLLITPGTPIYIVGADYRTDSQARLIASGILERYVTFEPYKKYGRQVIGAIVHVEPPSQIGYERLLLIREGSASIWEDQCLVMLYGILPGKSPEQFSSPINSGTRRLYITQYALLMTSCVLENLDTIQVLAFYKKQRDEGTFTVEEYEARKNAYLAIKEKERRIHNEAKQHLDTVSRVLRDFANRTWGDLGSWNWSLKPAYVNYEANSFNYEWLGTITKQGYSKTGDVIAGDRLSVLLEEEDAMYRFRVIAFRDYGYNYQDAAAYLCVTEVSVLSKPNPSDLEACMEKLHGFLTASPINLTTRGDDRPDLDDKRLRYDQIEIRTRVLAKHT
jgi:hypothetical protein